MGDNIFTHTAQIAGHYKGGAAGIWGRSRGAGPPPGRTYESSQSAGSIELLMALQAND